MKKQKFRPYEEPIFRKPMIPFRTSNIVSAQIMNKTPHIKNSQSMHKKPEHILSNFDPFDQPKMNLLDDDRSHTCIIKERVLRKKFPIEIFLNKEFEPVRDHKSLRKIAPLELENYSKMASSQGRHTINIKSTKSSDKKIHNSAFLSSKDATILKMKNFTASPYLRNISDVSKIFKMLKPVKGPTESIKKQILQHNEDNKKNHELVVLRRANQTFDQKRQTYLERIGLKSDSKVFVMNSRDHHIRNALIKQGWIELHDISDSFYHLKWVYSDNSNDYANLNNNQLFNHFHNNQQLTNKNNLRKNIKAVKPENRPLIPLTFDFGIAKEFRKFVENATLFEGIKILNLIKNTLQQYDPYDYERIISNPNYFKFHNRNALVKIARGKSKSKIHEFIGLKEETNGEDMFNLVSNCIELLSFLAKELEKETQIQNSVFKAQNNDKRGQNILSVFDYFQSLVKLYQMIELLMSLPKFLKVQLIKMHHHFQNMKSLYRNSYGYENSWIIKPTGVSRGSGIYIESDYLKLMTQTNNQHGKIVQKYIQRPLLLSDGRKFDMRQWVLVKSFDPLEVYIYKNLYGRICPQKYTETDFQNIQKHLTNYSLSKEHYRLKNVGSTLGLSQNEDQSVLFNHVGMKKLPAASIILEQDLKKQIDESSNNKKSWTEIKFQIKQNIIKTVKACSGGISQNSNCFQVYGFDILLDEYLNVFVIEVNLSPACEKREGLEVYLDEMGHGLVDMMESWLGLKQSDFDEESVVSQAWERIDEKIIEHELDKIKRLKVRQQKAIIIQKWAKSHIIGKR